MKKFLLITLLMVFVAPMVASAAENTKLPRDFSLEIKPGKIHEECIELKKDAEISYRFKASQPMPFNIHFHTGKGKDEKVEYPVKIDKADAKDDVLRVAFDEHYCWMWSNKTGQAVSLQGQIGAK